MNCQPTASESSHNARRRLLVALLAASAFRLAYAEPPLQPNPVGLSLVDYEDSTRANWSNTGKRPLATAVWYPAPAATPQIPWQVSIFNAGNNAIGAPVVAQPEKLPLILLSHGTGGSAATMAWLAEALAAHGYLVAAVNHHGNTGYEPAARLEGFAVWWDRPKDLSAVLDKLLADPRFGPRIDPTRIGVAGFSIGGYTALASVGARISYAQWQSYCAAHATDSNCKLPPEAKFSNDELRRMLESDQRVRNEIAHSGGSFRDARIRAAFVIAPALGPVYTTASLAAIQVPIQIVVGSKDDQTLPEVNAKPIAAAIPAAKLEVLPEVTHYTFLADCNLFGRVVARRYCIDPEPVDRSAVHAQIGAKAVRFFDSTLAAVVPDRVAQSSFPR